MRLFSHIKPVANFVRIKNTTKCKCGRISIYMKYQYEALLRYCDNAVTVTHSILL